MSKYSKEFIIKTCEEYLSCNASKLELCNKYGIHYKNGKSIIDDWIPRYLEDGADAFLSTVGNKVYLSSDKISAVEDYIEEKGSLYFCIDLNQPKHIFYDTTSYGNSIEEQFKTEAYKSHPNEDLKNALDKCLGKETTFQDFVDNISTVRSSDVYKNVYDALESICDDAKVSLKLKDGQFPNISNREVMPILILDLNSGKIDYCKKYRAMSYREGREKVFINDITDRIVKDAFESTKILQYCKIDVIHKSVSLCDYL